MTDTAEEALAALARDLVEEIAQGRALELAGVPALDSSVLDELELAVHQRDILELVSFVRPFQRRSPSGTHMEQVRGYQENRKPGMGLPSPGRANELGAQPEGGPRGWIPEDDWLKGEQEWKAKGEAAWKKHEWKGAKKPKSTNDVLWNVRDTREQLPGGGAAEAAQDKAQAAAWGKADAHLGKAQEHLMSRSGRHPEPGSYSAKQPRQPAPIDQDEAAKAYHELARAHEHIVSHIVPHARPEHYPDIAQHLQRIAGHMQDLDQAMGANPQATRKLLGSGKEAMAHAGEARREQEGAAAAAKADQAAREQATQQEHQRAIAAGPQAHRQFLQQQGTIPPPKGAAAVHPHLGGHLVTHPGGTVSGHAYAHVPKPVPALGDQAALQAQQEALAARKQQETGLRQQAREAAREERLANAALERQGISPPGTYAPLTDSQFAVHTRNVEKALIAAVNAGMATDQAYTLDGKGQAWEPDRAMVHADIVKEHLDKQVNVPSQRAALFMGGLPGAGKSTLLKQHPDINLKDYAVVNPDDFKEELARRGMVPPVEGLSPMERATLIHEESVHLANLTAAELQRRGKNLAFDVTMKSKRATLPRIEALKERGYHVTAVFVDVPPEKSAERVIKRYRGQLEKYRNGTNPLGGRYVPENIIMAGEAEPGVSRARVTFDALRPKFDRWELYDNKEGTARLTEKSGPPSPSGIASVEELQKAAAAKASAMRAGAVKPYTGNTEQEARAAEKGTAR